MPEPSSSPAMLSFQASMHARPPALAAGADLELPMGRYQTLSVGPEAMAAALGVSFEEAGQALARLERLFFEPDGSFVWTSSQAGLPWQVDGNVFDRDGRVLFVDLKGNCPGDQLDRLLSAFGWPATALMFQLTRQAVFLDEPEFRRFAAEAGGEQIARGGE